MNKQSIPTLLVVLLLAVLATAREGCNKQIFTSSFENSRVWTLHPSPPTGIVEITEKYGKYHSGKKSLYAAWDPSLSGGGYAETTLPKRQICWGRKYKFSAWTLAPSMGAYVTFSIDGTYIAQTPMTPAGFGRWYKLEAAWLAPAATPHFEGVLRVDFHLSRELTKKIDIASMFVDDITLAA